MCQLTLKSTVRELREVPGDTAQFHPSQFSKEQKEDGTDERLPPDNMHFDCLSEHKTLIDHSLLGCKWGFVTAGTSIEMQFYELKSKICAWTSICLEMGLVNGFRMTFSLFY